MRILWQGGLSLSSTVALGGKWAIFSFNTLFSLLLIYFLLILQSKHIYGDNPQLVTFLTFGSCSILASLLTLLLPETQFKNLPDTVREGNDLNLAAAVAAADGRTVGHGGVFDEAKYDDLLLIGAASGSSTVKSKKSLISRATNGTKPHTLEVRLIMISINFLHCAFLKNQKQI